MSFGERFSFDVEPSKKAKEKKKKKKTRIRKNKKNPIFFSSSLFFFPLSPVKSNGVKNAPIPGISLRSLDRAGSARCCSTHRSSFAITSAAECVACIDRMKSIRASCSFKCPLRLKTPASEAERARAPSMSGSGVLRRSDQ